MNTKSILKVTTITGLILGGAASGALAQNLSDNKVVRDSQGDPIRSSLSGNCVRTEWETKNNINPCAVPKPYAVKKQPDSYARMIMNDEKIVYFDFDDASLTEQAKGRLDEMAYKLKRSSDVREAHIVGYADEIGSSDYNKQLSQQRAESVKNYLADQGYINTRVADIRGLGESSPVTNCEADQVTGKLINCLQPDRRVEVDIKFIDTVRVSSR